MTGETSGNGNGRPRNLIGGGHADAKDGRVQERAVARASGVKYGLAAGDWTRDHGRAMRMTKALDFGAVWVSTHIPFVSEMPHGGFMHSGYGTDLAMDGVEDGTRVKHVMPCIGE